MRENKFTSATTIFIAINVLVFAIEYGMGGSMSSNFITDNFTMYTPYVLSGQVWRLFTAMFLHFGGMHIFMNMLALYNIGYFLESYIGTKKYVWIYLLGGICGNLAALIVDMSTKSYAFNAGASGAIFAVLGAILCIAFKDRNSGLNIANLIVSIAFAMLPGFVIEGISWSAHLGGFIGGFVLALLLANRSNCQAS